MAYYTNLFSPETYDAFTSSERNISGFRMRHENTAKLVKPGDKLVCYLTKLSRWVGILDVIHGPFIADEPIFFSENDPFVVRFRVSPSVWLPVDRALPIKEDQIWNSLSFTHGQAKSSSAWTGKLRGSLVKLEDADGVFLEKLIRDQHDGGKPYPFDPVGYKKLTTHRVRRADKDVLVTVPEVQESDEEAVTRPEIRESIMIQALLTELGFRMGMQIWVPKSDRGRVLAELPGDHPPLLERLPLNYDDTTLKTIEQIDVLWLKGRAIKRAFEVEHTTSVYSGILRMADLLALQPNMNIRLHIVAPSPRKEKVFQELRRPVFSLLERGPLSENCTYLSYDSVRELAELPHLSHLSDSVVGDYEEVAEE